MQAVDCVKVMKSLGEETRIKIFEMLRGGKKCACNILDKLNISQPTLSHHMKILCDSGIVKAEKDWKWTHYSINEELLQEVLDYLSCCKGNRTGDSCCD